MALHRCCGRKRPISSDHANVECSHARGRAAASALQRRHRFRRRQCRARSRRQDRIHGLPALADLSRTLQARILPLRGGVEGFWACAKKTASSCCSMTPWIIPSRSGARSAPASFRPRQYAAHRRAICLPVRGQPRRGAVVAAPLARCTVLSIRDRLPYLREIIVVGASAGDRAQLADVLFFEDLLAQREPQPVRRADDVGRGGVLDVHVGIDRRSQGGQARSHQPDRVAQADGPGHHRHPRG